MIFKGQSFNTYLWNSLKGISFNEKAVSRVGRHATQKWHVQRLSSLTIKGLTALFSTAKLRATGRLRENERQGERDKWRQITEYLLWHGEKCGYHCRNKGRNKGFSRSDCTGPRGRKISSVANWSTKPRIPVQSQKSIRCWQSDEDAGEWERSPNLSYALGHMVLVTVWVWRKSKREKSRDHLRVLAHT